MSKQEPAVGLASDNEVPCPDRASLSATDVTELALAFKALGDPIRLQLLLMIATHPHGEACVCDLTPAFAVSGPTISHHLKTLRQAGLVSSDRRGTWVFYRLVAGGVLQRLVDTLQGPGRDLGDVEPRTRHHMDCRGD